MFFLYTWIFIVVLVLGCEVAAGVKWAALRNCCTHDDAQSPAHAMATGRLCTGQQLLICDGCASIALSTQVTLKPNSAVIVQQHIGWSQAAPVLILNGSLRWFWDCFQKLCKQTRVIRHKGDRHVSFWAKKFGKKTSKSGSWGSTFRLKKKFEQFILRCPKWKAEVELGVCDSYAVLQGEEHTGKIFACI